jgi:hypothetical protein
VGPLAPGQAHAMNAGKPINHALGSAIISEAVHGGAQQVK